VSELPSPREVEALTHAIFGPMGLHALTCPSCDKRFGMEPADVRFAEQTGEIVFCPRGHKLKLAARPPADGR
jgi:hypothetical protein